MNITDLQPVIWNRLSKIISNQKIGTSYLFSGPNGSGKEWTAIEFSKLLNCELKNSLPCNTCTSCHKFSKLQHENLNLIFQFLPLQNQKLNLIH